MGQLCGKEESKKASAFQESDGDAEDVLVDKSSNDYHNNSDVIQQQQQQYQRSMDDPTSDDHVLSPEQQREQDAQAERLKALRQEQARLELIVSNASRDMVAVRSARGNMGYYDQGFAAALAQHLEQTANDTVFVQTLPPAIEGINVVDVLSRKPWEGIVLGPLREGDGLAGCAGENPHTYMDHVAESYLASVVPAKEQLFAGVGPMVENLL